MIYLFLRLYAIFYSIVQQIIILKMLRLDILRLGRTILQSARNRSASDSIKYGQCACRFLTSDTVSKEVYNLKQNDNTVHYANKLGLDNYLISEMKKCIHSFQVNSDQFANNCKVLVDFGFTSNEVVEFMKDCPKLFYNKDGSLENSLYLWAKWTISNDLLILILCKQPTLIDIMGKEVMKRIEELLPYFQKDTTVGYLFSNCPATVYENWATLKGKLDFLHSHNISMASVANCCALDFSLRQMKVRFTFLERAGIYKQRVDLFKKDAKVRNPPVSFILCSDDKKFAENVAGLTLIEYEAFVDIFNAEMDDSEAIENS